MNRRGFLKGLSAVALIPVALKEVVAKPELSNLEKAIQVDSNFDSPFLYVRATEDVEQGDVVKFDKRSSEYSVCPCKGMQYEKAVGIVTTNAKKDEWFFIQTVGHCKLPIREGNYFKKLGYE